MSECRVVVTNDIPTESPAMSKQLTSEDRAVLSAIAFDEHSPTGNCPASQEEPVNHLSGAAPATRAHSGYLAEEAQQRTDVRRWVNHRVRKMDDPVVRKYVCQGLKRYWSPDQIAGRSQLDFRGEPRRQISRQTIYQWIHARPKQERCP